MSKISQLRNEVRAVYEKKMPHRARWSDWIYEGHVVHVGEASRQIAERFGGDPDLAEAAGLLHDIADAEMPREDPQNEIRSLEMARELLAKTGFSKEEIEIVVNDAILHHSCRGDDRPQTPEGKAMAAGDAFAHLATDFYFVVEEGRKGFQTPQEIADFVLPKIERDFINKIAFDELREEVRPLYEKLVAHFT